MVRQWFERALPVVSTTDFDTTWFDFLHAWDGARFPLGSDLAEEAFERAKGSPLPDAAVRFDSSDLRMLVAACRELQRMVGDQPFSLSCSQVARLLWGRSDDTGEWEKRRVQAHRLLKGLVRTAVLTCVRAGKPGPPGTPASRYRYLPKES